MASQEKLAQKTLKRYNKAKEEATLWRSSLEEVYQYVIPNRDLFSTYGPGQKKDQLVFDSSPLIATNKYVSRLQNLLVRPWTEWFTLTAGTEIKEEEKEQINDYLQKATDVVMDAINHSNFSTQIAEAFTDLAVSTGVIMVNEDNNPHSDSDIIFKTIPLSHVALENSSTGDVKTVYREFQIPLNQITATWNKAKLTPEMNDIYEENPTALQTIIECTIYREEDYKFDFVLLTPTGKILLSETIDDSPFIVFRENVVSGESFGRGRLMSLISDIKTLNKTVELGLKAASLAISGVFTAVDDGIINVKNIRLQPGAVIPVGSNSSTNPSLAPLQSPANFQIEQMLVQEIRTRINEYMLVEPFGDINDTSVRTATEMNMRQNDFIQTSVSSFSRLQTELLSKIVNKVIAILVKKEKLPPLTIDGKEIKVQYTSPVAKMQGSEEIQEWQQFMEIMQTIPPEVAQTAIKFDKIPDYIATALSLDKTLLRTTEERKQLTEKNIEMQQMAQSKQMMDAQKLGANQAPQAPAIGQGQQ
ncbi:MAG: hypothetical protein DRH57_05320 [Candidatus Cloacimonadota bacterium]|nr:MAG: hypothetical protein DRH57_05320 [Candidatus Cloacimonadota bacterium]